jgi:ABC-type transporter Mla MlaB component
MARLSRRTLTLAVGGPIARADVDVLAERLCEALDCGSDQLVDCDVSALTADAVSVEALARLELAARRRGSKLRLIKASPELRELVALMGLSETLRL